MPMNAQKGATVIAALAPLYFVVACDRGSELVEPAVDAVTMSVTGAEWSEWSVPVNLGPTVNSPFADNVPDVTRDGLSLYFSSNRPGGSGAGDLWASRRASVDDPWGVPVNLGPTVNSSAVDLGPNVSPDGHYLFFTSNRPGSLGLNDI